MCNVCILYCSLNKYTGILLFNMIGDLMRAHEAANRCYSLSVLADIHTIEAVVVRH